MAARPILLSAALIVLTSFAAPICQAADHWIRLTTPHFEILTTNSEKQATAALNVFEQVRYFFLENSKWKPAADTRVRIIAFRSEKEFKPYRFNEGSFAYYLRTPKVDYIIMQDLNPEHYQAVMHEYTHLVIEHAGLKLPVWLNEGIADVYSSLEPHGNQALVGRALEGRMPMLMNQSWMDLNLLFVVGQDSPYYNKREKMSVFYAESWALTHMLVMSEEYSPHFSKFMAAIASGQSAADSLQSAYGKTPAQVTRELKAYINRSTLRAAVFDIKLSKSELEPELSDPSDLTVDLALTDLLANQKKNWAEAQTRLTKLAADHPDNADIQESLGYLAWAQGNLSKARNCFKLAYDRGSKSPQMLTHYTQFMREAGATPNELIPVMRRVVDITPDDQTAWLNLGVATVNAGQYGVALGALSHVKTITPDRAYALFSMQAFCNFKLKAPQQARELAERAQKYAETPEQQLQISHILSAINSTDANPAVDVEPSAEARTGPLAQTKTKR